MHEDVAAVGIDADLVWVSRRRMNVAITYPRITGGVEQVDETTEGVPARMNKLNC